MKEEKIVIPTGEAAAPAETEENPFLVKLNKPYTFEGEVVEEIDLSGLEGMSAEDMIAADKYLTRAGSFSVMPEMTLEYACFIASRATHRPVEFFKRLPPKEAIKLKNCVTNFFYGED